MNRENALLIMTEMQKWRRGVEPYDEVGVKAPYSPQEFGAAIDYCLWWIKSPASREEQDVGLSSFFRLEAIYDDGEMTESDLPRKLTRSFFGHYSSLERAEDAMNSHIEKWEQDALYAYLISEIPIDQELGNVSFMSVRSYSKDKANNDACLDDYNLCNAFKGRTRESIKHEVGDIVECILGDHLVVGIVAALPPTPEDGFPLLDALDDCYLILPCSEELNEHFHVPCTHVFPLKHQLKDADKALLYRLLDLYVNADSSCKV